MLRPACSSGGPPLLGIPLSTQLGPTRRPPARSRKERISDRLVAAINANGAAALGFSRTADVPD